MSYDVYLLVDTGAGNCVTAFERNHTSNCAPMWRAAGVDLRELEEWSANRAAPLVRAAEAAMRTDPDTYRAMNPPNGWGDYDSAVAFITAIADACEAHPNAELHISY